MDQAEQIVEDRAARDAQQDAGHKDAEILPGRDGVQKQPKQVDRALMHQAKHKAAYDAGDDVLAQQVFHGDAQPHSAQGEHQNGHEAQIRAGQRPGEADDQGKDGAAVRALDDAHAAHEIGHEIHLDAEQGTAAEDHALDHEGEQKRGGIQRPFENDFPLLPGDAQLLQLPQRSFVHGVLLSE